MLLEKCFYRVSTKAIIVNDEEQILLIQESDGLWELPGGGLEHNQEIKESLKREIREELGVNAIEIAEKPDYIWCSDRKKEKGYYGFFVGYKVKVDSLNIKKGLTDECVDFAFYNAKDLDKVNLHPNLRDFIKLIK